MDKRIEIIELPVSELKTEFGNPRKPLKKKAKEKPWRFRRYRH